MKTENNSKKNIGRIVFINLQLLAKSWYNTDAFTENFQAKDPGVMVKDNCLISNYIILRNRRFKCLDN